MQSPGLCIHFSFLLFYQCLGVQFEVSNVRHLSYHDSRVSHVRHCSPQVHVEQKFHFASRGFTSYMLTMFLVSVDSETTNPQSTLTRTKPSALTRTKPSEPTRTKPSVSTRTKQSALTRTKPSALTRTKLSVSTRTKLSASTTMTRTLPKPSASTRTKC